MSKLREVWNWNKTAYITNFLQMVFCLLILDIDSSGNKTIIYYQYYKNRQKNGRRGTSSLSPLVILKSLLLASFTNLPWTDKIFCNFFFFIISNGLTELAFYNSGLGLHIVSSKSFLEPAVTHIRLFLVINMMPLKRCVVKGN